MQNKSDKYFNNMFFYDPINNKLREAVCDENFAVVRWLVNNGADITAENAHGESSLSIAKKYNFIEIVNYFESLIETPDNPHKLIGKKDKTSNGLCSTGTYQTDKS